MRYLWEEYGDYLPWLAVLLTAIIVIGGVVWISLDVGSAREYCADLGMLYNPDYHGCVEGVNIP